MGGQKDNDKKVVNVENGHFGFLKWCKTITTRVYDTKEKGDVLECFDRITEREYKIGPFFEFTFTKCLNHCKTQDR
jgi:hypothetical protein